MKYDWFNYFGFQDKHTFNKAGSLEHHYYLRRSIKDPELRDKLTPKYRFGCKRVLKSDEYFPAFAEPNIALITSGIDGVTERGIVSGGVETPVDVIILATGFKVQDFFAPMTIVGKDNLDVMRRWQDDFPKTYYGICSHGMPNNFILVGPSTGLGHNSIVFMIECQTSFIMQVLEEMERRKASHVEVKEEAQEDFYKYITKEMKNTIWGNEACASWYANSRGEITALWPKNCTHYWNETRLLDPSKFDFSFFDPKSAVSSKL
jgi:cation diffusion facilitator CzcD-associated flavoprotein CzcO